MSAMKTLSTEVSLRRVAINNAEFCDDLKRAFSLPARGDSMRIKA